MNSYIERISFVGYFIILIGLLRFIMGLIELYKYRRGWGAYFFKITANPLGLLVAPPLEKPGYRNNLLVFLIGDIVLGIIAMGIGLSIVTKIFTKI